MSGDESYLIRQQDPLEILKSQDRGALSQLLKDPQSALAGALIETFSHGPSAWTGPLVRVAVASLTGRALQQLAQEIKDFQDKGKMAEDWADDPKGYQTWVELLRVIDDESPDQEKLDALKAMFFAVNRFSSADGRQIVPYQLFQIAKRLTSGDLLVLKAVYEMHKKGNVNIASGGYREWAQKVALYLGHSLTGLIDRAETTLIENCLLSPRADKGHSIDITNLRLTDLALELCQNIERYHIERKP